MGSRSPDDKAPWGIIGLEEHDAIVIDTDASVVSVDPRLRGET
jgi:hypothetical protein